MRQRSAKNHLLLAATMPVLAVAALLAVWSAAAAVTGAELILPSPAQTLAALMRCLGEGAFWGALGGTVLRTVLSFLLSLALAVTLCMAGTLFRPLGQFLRPLVAVLRSVPTMSVILLMLIWSGARLTPLWVALLVIFPVLYTGLEAAHGTLDPSLEETAKIYRIAPLCRVTRIYLPLAAPAFLTTAAGAISLNLKLVVAAEVLAQTRDSIGRMMQQAQILFETGRLLALTVAAVLAALVLEYAVLLVRRVIVKKLFG